MKKSFFKKKQVLVFKREQIGFFKIKIFKKKRKGI